MNSARRVLPVVFLACAPTTAWAAPGDLDQTFDPELLNTYPSGIATQPDGKILVTTENGQLIFGRKQSYIARYKPDGSLDNTFGSTADGRIYSVGVQADGKILIGGSFTKINNENRYRLARLNADGSLDRSFEATTDYEVDCIAPLDDGKILIGGAFLTVNGEARWRVARLNPNGSLDEGFPNPLVRDTVRTLAVQADGKILIGGSFDRIGDVMRLRVARLNADGTLDTGFIDPDVNGGVYAVALQADGKVVVGGTFTRVAGATRNRIARLNSNGALDSSYSPSLNDLVYSMVVQADGKAIVSGRFTRVGSATRVYIARFLPDGALDQDFAPVGGEVNNAVVGTALQSDGKLLVSGNFSRINGLWRPSLARILNGPATGELSVPSNDRVQWMRGGTAPELNRVWFERSTDNGRSWSRLAGGTRITGGWQLAGLSLPGDGLIRARGVAAGGKFSGSSSMEEAEVSYSFPPPAAATLAASGITGVGAVINGEVKANRSIATVAFEYGLTEVYGASVAASPATVTGELSIPVIAALGGLSPGTTYHYRVVATNPTGTTYGDDRVFTTLSDNANLVALDVSEATLAPGFAREVLDYVVSVPHSTNEVMVTPVVEHPGASVVVNAVPVTSGSASGNISLPVGNTTIVALVTAEDRVTTKGYTLTVTRLPLEFVFNSAADIPVSARGFSAGGLAANPVLNFGPVPGTVLTMVDNVGTGFIHGSFGNLSQGQRLSLSYGGKGHDFVVNYFGGTGNDLVLQWAATRIFAWGGNEYGQLGNGSADDALVPTEVLGGPLSHRSVTAVSAGYLHSLALCADGTLAAWGYNAYGQLGNGDTVASSVPVEVDLSGVLAGRTVVSISAGPFHNLALCSDGTVASWGYNNHGQLGTGDTVARDVPVVVPAAGALAGKQVTRVAAGAYQSFALCSDGSVVGWGYNDEGELGNGLTGGALVPVAIDTSGALAGRRVVSIAVGLYHALARCSDGTLATWGWNGRGQLGDASTTSSAVPVDVSASGVLAGKTVAGIASGGNHSLARCSDGMIAGWGDGRYRQLGSSAPRQSAIPLAVELAGLAAPVEIAAVGRYHNLALPAGGGPAAWGDNDSGQLGDGSTSTTGLPVAVDGGAWSGGARFMFAAGGCAAHHNLAVVGMPAGVGVSLPRGGEVLAIGGDFEDPDHDGIPNLVEYAFGLDPVKNSAGELPTGQVEGGDFVISFAEPEGVAGIEYRAEWSTTMESGSWQDVPDTGTGGVHEFRMSLDRGPRLFMRLRVNRR